MAPDQDGDEFAQGIAAQFTELLEKLLPDDAPEWVVAGTLSGICGAVILDMWSRSPGGAEDVERLKVAWQAMGVSIIDQLKPETMQ